MTMPSNSRIHRAPAVLTSSYVAPAALALAPNIRSISFVYSYALSEAGGATGGYARVRPIWTVAGVEARDVSTDTAVVTDDEIEVPIKQLACSLPSATGVGVLVFEVPPGAESVSFSAKEVGDTGHPGTLASWIAGY